MVFFLVCFFYISHWDIFPSYKVVYQTLYPSAAATCDPPTGLQILLLMLGSVVLYDTTHTEILPKKKSQFLCPRLLLLNASQASRVMQVLLESWGLWLFFDGFAHDSIRDIRPIVRTCLRSKSVGGQSKSAHSVLVRHSHSRSCVWVKSDRGGWGRDEIFKGHVPKIKTTVDNFVPPEKRSDSTDAAGLKRPDGLPVEQACE